METKAKRAAKNARFRAAHPGYDAAYALRRNAARPDLRVSRNRFNRTGFTPEAFQAAIAKQGNACAICLAPFTAKRYPCGDHMETPTGKKPRGALCHHCNGGLGLLGDSPVRLINAAKYLIDRGYAASE